MTVASALAMASADAAAVPAASSAASSARALSSAARAFSSCSAAWLTASLWWFSSACRVSCPRPDSRVCRVLMSRRDALFNWAAAASASRIACLLRADFSSASGKSLAVPTPAAAHRRASVA
ncbi:MAG: hypothetical protein V4772_07955 [Pseudomonadota bacterium]